MKDYKYPYIVRIFAFGLIALSGCGFFGVEKYFCPYVITAGLLQGLVVTGLEKAGASIYIQRFLGIFIPTFYVLAFYNITRANHRHTPIFLAIYMAVASGTLIIDGLCNFHTRQGKKDVYRSLLIAFCLGMGSFLALEASKLIWKV